MSELDLLPDEESRVGLVLASPLSTAAQVWVRFVARASVPGEDGSEHWNRMCRDAWAAANERRSVQ